MAGLNDVSDISNVIQVKEELFDAEYISQSKVRTNFSNDWYFLQFKISYLL